MKNQQGDSLTHRVRQNGPVFPPSDTLIPPLTPSQAHYTEWSLAALRGEPVDARRAKPQPSKQFQKASRLAPAATPSVLTSDQGDDQDAVVLPEIVQDARRRLAQQAHENRETRRVQDRARLHQLLTAATDEAAPDFVPPVSLQESRQGASGQVRVTLPRPATTGPAWGGLSADAVLEAAPWVSNGAKAVFRILHYVGVGTGEDRAYPVIPSSSAFHLPQLLLAAVAKYTARHLRRLAAELKRAGLIDWGGHAANVTTALGEQRHMWDGTIWAVKLKPSNCNAYLAPEDWQHEWRDFDADLKAGRTAEKLMSYLKTCEGLERQYHLVKQWAVNPNGKFTSLSLDRTFRDAQKNTLQDVVYALPLLADLSGARLAQAIGSAASTISHALRDTHSRRFWCGLLWEAMRNGSLEAFSAQLLRLFADMRESSALRKPGALFAARLQTT